MKERDELEGYEDEIERYRRHRSVGESLVFVVGGLVIVGLATLVAISLPDLKRYIRISTM